MADGDAGVPTKDEIARLPRRAVVAFAARCARRALPHFVRGWPDAPIQHVEAVEHAVRVAEEFAAASATLTNSRSVSVGATAAADAAANARSGANVRAAAFAAAFAARTVDVMANADRTDLAARAAAFASDAAFANAHDVAAVSARDVAASNVAVAIRSDFELLVQASGAAGWDDSTPVLPIFFPPLSDSETPVAPSAEPESDPADYTLRFEVPAGVSDDEFITTLKELLDAGDDLHRALGGHGIQVTRIEAHDHVPTLVPIGGSS